MRRAILTRSIAGLVGLATSAHYVATAAVGRPNPRVNMARTAPRTAQPYIKTPMTKETMDERHDEIIARCQYGASSAREIAEAVVWMCSTRPHIGARM